MNEALKFKTPLFWIEPRLCRYKKGNGKLAIELLGKMRTRFATDEHT